MSVSNPGINRPGEDSLLRLPPSERTLFLGPTPYYLYHPLVILGWQLVTCTLAWSFVMTLASRGEIPLSDALASRISQ